MTRSTKNWIILQNGRKLTENTQKSSANCAEMALRIPQFTVYGILIEVLWICKAKSRSMTNMPAKISENHI